MLDFLFPLEVFFNVLHGHYSVLDTDHLFFSLSKL